MHHEHDEHREYGEHDECEEYEERANPQLSEAVSKHHPIHENLPACSVN